MANLPIGSVPPPTAPPTISGGPLSGQALSGWTGSAQFGVPSIRGVAGLIVAPGVPPSTATVQTVCGQVACGTPGAVCGYYPGGQFGNPRIYTKVFGGVPGLGSAQQFGAAAILPGPVKLYPIAIGSAAQFGTPFVYVVWVHPLYPADCRDVDLASAPVTTVTLVPAGCQ